MTTRIHILSARISSQVQSFVKGLDQAARATQRLRQQWAAAGTAVASAASRIGAAATAMSAVAIREFVKFEDELSKIEGLVGIAASEVEKFGNQLGKIGVQTAKPITELAEGLFFVTSAGFRGKEAIDVLTASAKASTAGLGSVKTVADAVTSAVNAYGVETLSASRATDILVAAVREGKLEAGGLAPVLGRLLPLASKMKIGFEDVAGVLALMSRTGTEAAEGSTSLQSIMTTLIKPADAAREALESVGLDFKRLREIAGRPGGLIEVIRILNREFKGDEESLAAIIPNIRALRGVMNVLAQDADTVSDVMKGVSDSVGATDKAFQAVEKSAGFRLRRAFVSLRIELKNLGAEILPMIVSVLEENKRGIIEFANVVSRLIARFVKFIALHPQIAAVFAVFAAAKLLGIVAAVHKLAVAIGSTLLVSVRSLQVGFVAMGASATAAWAAATLGVSALVTAIVALIANFSEVRKFFTDLIGFGKDTENKVGQAFEKVKAIFLDVVGVLKRTFGPTIAELKNLFVNDLLPVVLDVGQEFFQVFAQIFKQDILPIIKDTFIPVLKDVLLPFLSNVLIPLIKNVLVPLLKFELVAAFKAGALFLKFTIIPIFKAWQFLIERVIDLLQVLGLVASDTELERQKRLDEEIKKRQEKLRLQEEELKKEAQQRNMGVRGAGGPRTATRPGGGPGMGGRSGGGRTSGDGASAAPVRIPNVAAPFVERMASLRRSLERGKISLDEYEKGIEKIERQIEAEGFRKAESELKREFREGKITIDQFKEGMRQLKMQVEESKRVLAEEAAQRREDNLRRLQQATEESRPIVESILTLGAMSEGAEQKATAFIQRLFELRQALANGSLSQAEYSKKLQEVSTAVQNTIQAEELARKQRLLKGEGTEADKAFLKRQIAEAKQGALTDRVNTSFQQLISRLAGFGNSTQKATKGLDQMQQRTVQFAQRMQQASQQAKPTAEQVQKLNQGLSILFGTRQGLIASIQAQIALLRQTISIVDDNRRRFQIMEQIRGLLTRLNQLLIPPAPPFVGVRSGFQGIVDPGLQRDSNERRRRNDGGSVTINVNTPATSGAQLVREIELELQRQGRRI